jgi:hypothetical protein
MSMLGKNILIKKDHFIAESGEEVLKPISSLSNKGLSRPNPLSSTQESPF